MTLPRIAMIMGLAALAGCVDSSNAGVKSTSSPASQLSVELTIVDAEATPADGKIPVVVKFFEANEYVRLGSAGVTVDGVQVPYSMAGYAARVPIVPAGGTITFTHVQSGVTSEFTYQVPPRPTITSPMTNEVVVRTTNVMISYVAGNGHAVRPLAADASLSTTGIEQSDNGTALLDVSGLRLGAGTIRLDRRYVTTPPRSGFGGATITYTITSLPTPVSWQ